MEDSFRVRVDKAFGSLSSTSPSSLWCLTDEEIERRGWSRERDGPDEAEPRPYPPNLDGFFANQQNLSSFSSSSQSSKTVDLQDDDNNDSDVKVRLRQPHLDDEEWDIRSSIGLDSTLDLEVPYPLIPNPHSSPYPFDPVSQTPHHYYGYACTHQHGCLSNYHTNYTHYSLYVLLFSFTSFPLNLRVDL